MAYDELTLTFKITDKEKFLKFHTKVFPSDPKDTKASIEDFGGYAEISSWSNPFDEKTNLENAVNFSKEKLFCDDRAILDLILEGKSEEEATKLYYDEEG